MFKLGGVLYKILIEFGIPRKLVRLIKISLTETYSRIRVGKDVSDRRRSIANSFNFALDYAFRRVRVN